MGLFYCQLDGSLLVLMSTDFNQMIAEVAALKPKGERTTAERMSCQRLQGFPSKEQTSCTPSKDMDLTPQAQRMSAVVSLNWAFSAKGGSIGTPWGHAMHGLVNISTHSIGIHSTFQGSTRIFPISLGVSLLGDKSTVSMERSQIFILIYLGLLYFKQSIS